MKLFCDFTAQKQVHIIFFLKRIATKSSHFIGKHCSFIHDEGITQECFEETKENKCDITDE